MSRVRDLLLLGIGLSLFAMPLLLGSARAAGAEKLVIDGSTTVGPIAKAFAEFYMENHRGVNVVVSESGSGNGAKSLINGTCDIADMSRAMKGKEFKAAVAKGIKPVAHVVALDGIAMVVHPANNLEGLRVGQIRDIYLGKVRNWRQLGGPNVPIVVVCRDSNSGTFETFHKLVMKKQKVASSAEIVGSNGAARQRVQTTRGAIAFVGLGYIDDSVKALEVNGVYPERATVASGKYPIARPLFMYTNGYPKMGSVLYQFATLHLTRKGQEMVESIGFVPVTAY
jgi:phosphate transport system substrate-binding protein